MEHNLLVAARAEYTEQLRDILSDGIQQGIKKIWDDCKSETKTNVLSSFQKKLCSIPEWNQEIINVRCKRAVEDYGISEEYLDKIIEAVFLSNVKILSVVKLNDKKQTINVSVPDTKHFIHRCYIESARRFYADPYLVDDRESGSNTQSEIQRNVKRSNIAIRDSIERTIRGMIPMEDILTKYLDAAAEDDTEIDHTEEEIHEPEPEPDFEPMPEPEPEPEIEFDSRPPEDPYPQIYQPYQPDQAPNPQPLQPPVSELFEAMPPPSQAPPQQQPQSQFFQQQQEKMHVNLKETDKHFFTDSE